MESLNKYELYKNELYKVLQEVRKLPEIYIRDKSIVQLEAFINGYTSYPEYDHEAYHCFKGFSEFVAKKHDIKPTHNWASIIRFYAMNDVQAFDQFYEDFDEFSKLSQEEVDNIIKASPFYDENTEKELIYSKYDTDGNLIEAHYNCFLKGE